MYRLGIIGLGNMGGAILRGALKANILKPDQVIIYEHNIDKIRDLLELGVQAAESEVDLVKNIENLLVSVKPQSFKGLFEKISGKIPSDTILVSIAAGISIQELEDMSDHKKIIRAMPNTPALVNAGMTSISISDGITEEDTKFTKLLFESVGEVTEIPEEKIDAFSGLAGCMPAFVYMFIEAAADAGVKNGIKRKDAYKYVSQALLGSAKMVLETGKHPGELKDQVTSPGGTTIRGVLALEESGFRNAVIQAVEQSSNAKIKF